MTDQRTSETTFAIATLGCKVNQADSESISEQMSAAIAGQKSVKSVLAQSQQYAQVVGDTYKKA